MMKLNLMMSAVAVTFAGSAFAIGNAGTAVKLVTGASDLKGIVRDIKNASGSAAHLTKEAEAAGHSSAGSKRAAKIVEMPKSGHMDFNFKVTKGGQVHNVNPVNSGFVPAAVIRTSIETNIGKLRVSEVKKAELVAELERLEALGHLAKFEGTPCQFTSYTQYKNLFEIVGAENPMQKYNDLIATGRINGMGDIKSQCTKAGCKLKALANSFEELRTKCIKKAV